MLGISAATSANRFLRNLNLFLRQPIELVIKLVDLAVGCFDLALKVGLSSGTFGTEG
jgi:hypothetical protein